MDRLTERILSYKDIAREEFEKHMEDDKSVATYWPIDEGYLHLGEEDMKSLKEYFKTNG